MDHAITFRDVLLFGVAVASSFVLFGVIVGLLWLFNPFRSGH